MTLSRAIVLAVSGVLLVVSVGVAAAQGTKAGVEIEDMEGHVVGNAQITEDSDGAQLTVQAEGLEPGEHGIHVHETGECGLPKFESAGKHFNPREVKHGLKNWEGPHAGDLPNLTANEDGSAAYEASTDGVSLSGGETYLFDADGSALVIHAKADDQVSDPAGNSGDRVACGVIKTSTAAQQGSQTSGGSGFLPLMLVAALAFVLVVGMVLWRRS